MKSLSVMLLLFSSLPSIPQNGPTFNIEGVLQYVDQPPEATPVEALGFRIHPLAGGSMDLEAQPDQKGRFVIKDVRPGRYELTFPMPGRLQSFAIDGRESRSEDFELVANESRMMSIVVSGRSASVAVKVLGLPSGQSNAIALLIPADDKLTLQYTCSYNRLAGSNTVFPFVPAGRYRILALNGKYQGDVAAYASRFPKFLEDEAASIEASTAKEVTVTATYVADETIEKAIQQAGGHFDPYKAANSSKP